MKYFLLLTLIYFVIGCESNHYLQEPTGVVSTYQCWEYECKKYEQTFCVAEQTLEAVYDCPLPTVDSEYRELLELSFGPGMDDIRRLSNSVLDRLILPATPRHELGFVLAFTQSLSQGAEFEYGHDLQYPLEVVFDGGNSSASLSALGAAMLNEQGFPVGIAVFWNECCPSDVHVALAVADFYPDYHVIDNFGVSWVFLETIEQFAPETAGERPIWLNDYSDWLVWPLWEQNHGKTSSVRKGMAEKTFSAEDKDKKEE